jgi:hypothetical protein
MPMSRPTVFRVLASTMEGPFERPMYLVEWDVDKYDGFGYARLSYDVDEAHVFPDAAAALEAWKTQSTVKPTRFHDGQPNRPLTAYTGEFLSLADAKASEARA